MPSSEAPVPQDVPRWETFGEETVLYDNPWVRLVTVDVRPPGGERFHHHVVRLHRVAVAVVVDDDRVLMLRRHRFATNEVGWELPGGIVDGGESEHDAAARETEEETGWCPIGPGRLLARYQPMPGMVDTPHDIWLFTAAQYTGTPVDLEESGQIEWMPLSNVPALIRAGEVLGSGSMVGLLTVLSGAFSQD